MSVNELKQIYQVEFRTLYETLGMSFSKLLNTLTYHLNLCQQLQDRVIFGGGESAALQLLADDPGESEDEEDDNNEVDDFFSLMRLGRSFHCKVCKRDLGNDTAYRTHLAGVKHRQQHILKKIRKSLQKPELTFDKKGIRVTSDPIGDENGVIELKVESGKYGQIVLIIENTSDEVVTLKHITLLWSVNFFDYSEISSIGANEGQLRPGNSCLTFTGNHTFPNSYIEQF
ncbi:hypothetical protein OS493_034054 [Desmophyllum pertusum]|uniref:C2H2-type domain-containing protein n=1 Tax=Desmophyllum pertusum TaxID=174260 RepID=A0A9X0CNR5_9CNID|nr:hypothetical protein OS493_034054 [Desmophyllum pertusum]